jgi:uncharacterized protein (UPF0332 family)
MEYVKTGVFSVELSKILGRAFEIRTESDYEDFFIIAKEDAERQLADARKYVDEIENYLRKI